MSAATWDEFRRRLAAMPAAAPDDALLPTDPGRLRRAAVLVPLYEADGEVFLLLTRRTDTVEHHKGQISFPGGAADGDEDLRQTVLREVLEEVGIPETQVEILGRLPDVDVVVSSYRVTPFVGIVPHPFPLAPNPHEIVELVRVPLAVFRDPANLRLEERERAGRRYRVYVYAYGDHMIWGATAQIVKHLVDLLAAPERPT